MTRISFSFALFIVLLTLVGMVLVFQMNTPTPSPEKTNVTTTLSSADPIASSSAQIKGQVKGKLCYPSQQLPQGKIEAKRITDGLLISEEYKGSQSLGDDSYTMNLEPGRYNLRYTVTQKGKTSYSYYTTSCPTGTEDACGKSNNRVLISADVESGKTVPDFNLCDYYTSTTNAPKF